MARGNITLDEKIVRKEVQVRELKEKYDMALDELEKLLAKRKQMEEKKILEAFRTSKKTPDEIIAFLKSKED